MDDSELYEQERHDRQMARDKEDAAERDRLRAELDRAKDCGSACGTVGHQCQACLRKMFHREVSRKESVEARLYEAELLLREAAKATCPMRFSEGQSTGGYTQPLYSDCGKCFVCRVQKYFAQA